MYLPLGINTILAGLAIGVSFVNAGFSSTSANNIAVYWGQNSYGQATGSSLSQQRLSYYCQNTNINIIPLAFLNVIVNPTTINFANAGDSCVAFSGTTLLSCPEIEADIKTCQSTYGKTILLSIGGATYTEGGFSSSSAAVTAANNIWAMFGPVQSGVSVDRPFNTSVVDGFDFDFESSTSNMAPFAQQLRTLMDAATASGDKSYFLSAAPQCPYPDVADNDMLNGAVSFDFIMVQFYNNYCGLQSFVSGSTTQSNFNFDTWDTWAHSVSLNKDVKVFLGIPGNTGAGTGYESGSTLASIISYCKTFSSFGGIMIWDMTQLYANSGFLDAIVADLGQTVTTTRQPATTLKATATTGVNIPTTLQTIVNPVTTEAGTATTSTVSSGSSLVPQWGQCGGIGYTGSTVCQTPYVCVANSVWWSQCETGPAQAGTTTTTSEDTSPSATNTVAQWGQCGGIGYTGSTTCQSPYVCVASSEWWSQCEAGPAPGTTTTTSDISPSPTDAVAQWGQCGGIGYTGSTVCASPYKCVANSVWWAQCQ